LAEQAGDRPAAILHYRAALASHAGVGVKRRLARLAPPLPQPASDRGPRGDTRRPSMNGRIQIVGRLPVALHGHGATAGNRLGPPKFAGYGCWQRTGGVSAQHVWLPRRREQKKHPRLAPLRGSY
jgi:hypothetical protein